MNTNTISLAIDGLEVWVEQGATILTAADAAGIDIPTLCHAPELKPSGVCRVCVVEIEGQKALAGACHTPAANGMVVRADTPRVQRARQTVIELMMAAHTGSCVTDMNAGSCRLHLLADQLEAGSSGCSICQPRFYPIEETNPYVQRDLSKCILCRRCTAACAEIAGQGVLSIGYRGFAAKIISGCDEPLDLEACRDCGICIEYCPTGALFRADSEKSPPRPPIDKTETHGDSPARETPFTVAQEQGPDETDGHIQARETSVTVAQEQGPDETDGHIQARETPFTAAHSSGRGEARGDSPVRET